MARSDRKQSHRHRCSGSSQSLAVAIGDAGHIKKPLSNQPGLCRRAMTDSAPPSTATVAVAVGLIAITVGYFLGQGSSLGLFGGSTGSSKSSSRKSKKSWPNSYDVTIHPDSSDDELMAQQRAGAGEQLEESESDDEGDGQELKAFQDTGEAIKLVLAVRTDLGMGKGAI